MNCDFIDLKQETVNCNGINLENIFSLVSDGLPIVPYCVEWLLTGYILLVTCYKTI